MWKIDNKAYPFRHKHPNHFPPSPESSSQNNNNTHGGEEDLWSEHQYQLEPNAYVSESDDEEVPIFFQRPSDIEGEMQMTKRGGQLITTQQQNWPLPLIPPPLLSLPPPPPRVPTPPPLSISLARSRHQALPLPPIPTQHLPHPSSTHQPRPSSSSLAPENVTTLLSSVLGIMNSIISQQALVASENELLEELTELVVILQEEAEIMLEHADLVEEFVGEVEVVEGLERWAGDLGVEGWGVVGWDEGRDGDGVLDGCLEGKRESGVWGGFEGEGEGVERREKVMGGGYGHEREESFDSGIGMGDRNERGVDGHVGELSFSLYKPREAERKQEEETVRRRPKEVEIKREEWRRRPREKEKENKPNEGGSGRSKPEQKNATPSKEVVRSEKSTPSRSKSSKELIPSREMVRYERGTLSRSKSSRDRDRKPPPVFRDSGLDLPSPQNRNRASGKPKWI